MRTVEARREYNRTYMEGYRAKRTPQQRQEMAAYHREYRQKNLDRLKSLKKAYYEANRAEFLRQGAEKRQAMDKDARRAYVRVWEKKRLLESLDFRLKRNIRRRVYMALKHGRAGRAVAALGCTLGEARAHIASLFQPGMTWDNWSPTGWHLDHIKPLKEFDLSDSEQFAQACHYTNLQPLWAYQNLRKSARTSKVDQK